MTKDDIIRMARKAGANPSYSPEKWDIWEIRVTDLERFAALVAAHEREECAQLLERIDLSGLRNEIKLQLWLGNMIMGFVEAIRARGKE